MFCVFYQIDTKRRIALYSIIQMNLYYIILLQQMHVNIGTKDTLGVQRGQHVGVHRAVSERVHELHVEDPDGRERPDGVRNTSDREAQRRVIGGILHICVPPSFHFFFIPRLTRED